MVHGRLFTQQERYGNKCVQFWCFMLSTLQFLLFYCFSAVLVYTFTAAFPQKSSRAERVKSFELNLKFHNPRGTCVSVKTPVMKVETAGGSKGVCADMKYQVSPCLFLPSMTPERWKRACRRSETPLYAQHIILPSHVNASPLCTLLAFLSPHPVAFDLHVSSGWARGMLWLIFPAP